MNMGLIRVRLSYALARAKREGGAWVIRESVRRGVRWCTWLIFLPLTVIGHFAGYRRVPVLTQRIGHLAAEVDCFLKLAKLGQIKIEGAHYFFTAPSTQVANHCLLSYWKPHITVVTNPLACWLLEVMSLGPLLKHDISRYVMAVGCTAEYVEVNRAWADRAPLLLLSDAHRQAGERVLREMGLPQRAWYVCVHAREGGYSPADEKVHDYRNMLIDTMFPAMRAITTRGGWCIRVGDPTMTPLPPIDGVIDYVHHSAYSPEMDIFLAASCRFFLGNTSGLFLVSSIFGTPSALCNMIPMTSMGFMAQDLHIFKLIRDRESDRILRAHEVIESPVAEYRMSSIYTAKGLQLVDNSPEEIADLVIEMLDRLDDSFDDAEGDSAGQAAFDALLRPGHYCYGTAARIAASFLRRHHDLFLT